MTLILRTCTKPDVSSCDLRAGPQSDASPCHTVHNNTMCHAKLKITPNSILIVLNSIKECLPQFHAIPKCNTNHYCITSYMSALSHVSSTYTIQCRWKNFHGKQIFVDSLTHENDAHKNVYNEQLEQ